MGSKCTVSVVTWPGFKVAGKVAPDREKPAPVSEAELMVTGAVPVELRVTDCVAAVLTCTFPKATLEVLRLSVAPPEFDPVAAFKFKVKPLETVPAVAVRLTAWSELTDETVAANPALVALAGTATVAGTVTAALLLEMLTVSPALGAAPFNVTVQASVPDPVMDALLQERELSTAVPDSEPLPCRLIVAVWLLEELSVMVSCPVASPSATGLNCTFRL